MLEDPLKVPLSTVRNFLQIVSVSMMNIIYLLEHFHELRAQLGSSKWRRTINYPLGLSTLYSQESKYTWQPFQQVRRRLFYKRLKQKAYGQIQEVLGI